MLGVSLSLQDSNILMFIFAEKCHVFFFLHLKLEILDNGLFTE